MEDAVQHTEDTVQQAGAGVLSRELQEHLLGAKSQDSANQLVVMGKKKKKSKEKPDPLAVRRRETHQEQKMSRAKRKRYERFLERQKKSEERKVLYESLAVSNITDEEAKLLFSSSSRGQHDTQKAHMKRTMRYSKAGMDLGAVVGQEAMSAMKTPFERVDVSEADEEAVAAAVGAQVQASMAKESARLEKRKRPERKGTPEAGGVSRDTRVEGQAAECHRVDKKRKREAKQFFQNAKKSVQRVVDELVEEERESERDEEERRKRTAALVKEWSERNQSAHVPERFAECWEGDAEEGVPRSAGQSHGEEESERDGKSGAKREDGEEDDQQGSAEASDEARDGEGVVESESASATASGSSPCSPGKEGAASTGSGVGLVADTAEAKDYAKNLLQRDSGLERRRRRQQLAAEAVGKPFGFGAIAGSSAPQITLRQERAANAREDAVSVVVLPKPNPMEKYERMVACPSAEPVYASDPVFGKLEPVAPVESTVDYVLVERSAEIEEARARLPIYMEEQRIMECIGENDVVVLCGETGSGKTTQVPQFLYESGYGKRGVIGVTQPRRVAAVSMARRVAKELGSHGARVGYQIRYDKTVSERTAVKFMTDGILLREIESDFALSRYSAIIIDEAHERNTNTDVLIGLLSRIVPLRRKLAAEHKPAVEGGGPASPLKLIIMSATLRVEDFAGNRRLFPTPPPVLSVEARQFPVTVHFSRRTVFEDYVAEAYSKVCKIHTRLPSGGILVFLTGQQEIEQLCKRLRTRFPKSLIGNPALQKELAEERERAERRRQADADADADDDAEAHDAAAVSGAGAAQDGASEDAADLYELSETESDDSELEELDEATLGKLRALAREERETVHGRDDRDVAEEADLDAMLSDDGSGNDDDDDDDGSNSNDNNDKTLNSGIADSAVGGNGAGSVGVDGSPAHSPASARQRYETTPDGKAVRPLYVLPLYGALSPSAQQRVFAKVPEGHRLCVVATNVAETAITISGVSYVVDCGRVKERVFDLATGISRFEVRWESQASARQRAGRAGRTAPGHCYCLFSSALFANYFDEFSLPELARTPAETVVLTMKAMGIDHVDRFPFPTPLDAGALRVALRLLRDIGLLDDAGKLTKVGRAAAALPVHPRLGKMLVLANESSCLQWMLTIVASLSVKDLFLPLLHGGSSGAAADNADAADGASAVGVTDSAHGKGAADAASSTETTDSADGAAAAGGAARGGGKQRPSARGEKGVPLSHKACVELWKDTDSDALAALKAVEACRAACGEQHVEAFCAKHRLHAQSMREIFLLRRQLASCISAPLVSAPPPTARQRLVIRQLVTSGLVDRVGVLLTPDESQRLGLARRGAYWVPECASPVRIHASSFLAADPPPCVAYFEVIGSATSTASSPFACVKPIGAAYEAGDKLLTLRTVTRVHPAWLHSLAPQLVHLTPPLLGKPARYAADAGEVRCFVGASYGARRWALPDCFVRFPLDVAAPPAFALRGCKEYFRLFAAYLLDGTVFPWMKRLAPCYETSIAVTVNSKSAKLVPVVLALQRRRVVTRDDLVREWQRDPTFLQKEVADSLVAKQRVTDFARLWHSGVKEAAKKKVVFN